MYADMTAFGEPDISSRAYAFTFIISAIFHVLLLALFIFTPGFDRQPLEMPQAISVDLVSLPGEPAVSGPEGPPAESSEPPVITADSPDVQVEADPPLMPDPEPVPEEIPQEPPDPVPDTATEPLTEEPAPEPPPEAPAEVKETVVIPDAEEEAAKPAAKREKNESAEIPPEQPVPLKKANPQTRKPAQVAKEAVKPAELPRSESIKTAVDRVRRSLDKKTGGGSSVSGSRSGRTGGRTGPVNDVYKAQVRYKIEQNWAFSMNLAEGRRDLKTLVTISVAADGSIRDVQIEKRSGNNYLDESAYRAVMKSTPLPPLPGGYSEYSFTLGFTPSGLN